MKFSSKALIHINRYEISMLSMRNRTEAKSFGRTTHEHYWKGIIIAPMAYLNNKFHLEADNGIELIYVIDIFQVKNEFQRFKLPIWEKDHTSDYLI